ncbi:MAG: hypothetical protein WCT51_00010 [Candidatus Shapirobacteria bacterium]|jgi:hypothetical protein
MTDDLSKNSCSKLALPIGRIKVLKFLYFILIVLGVLVLIIGGTYLYVKKDINKTSVNKTLTTNQDAVEASNSEIVKSVIDWLDGERDERGMYWFSQKCLIDEPNNCQKKEKSSYSGIAVMWGMNKYYLETKDQNILNTIKNDINNYDDRKKNPSIGTNKFGCKLLMEIKVNNDLTEIDKKKLDSICIKIEYPDSIDYKKYNKRTDEIKLSLNKKIKTILDSDTDNFNYSSDQYTDLIKNVNLNEHANYTSEYIYRNKLILSEEYTRKSYLIFDIILDLYLIDPTILNRDELACKIGRSALDLNQLEENKNYSELAKKIFNWYSNKNSLDCAMLASNLYKETNDKKFLNYKNNYLTSLKDSEIENSWENGFITRLNENDFERGIYENGLIVGLLSE